MELEGVVLSGRSRLETALTLDDDGPEIMS